LRLPSTGGLRRLLKPRAVPAELDDTMRAMQNEDWRSADVNFSATAAGAAFIAHLTRTKRCTGRRRQAALAPAAAELQPPLSVDPTFRASSVGSCSVNSWRFVPTPFFRTFTFAHAVRRTFYLARARAPPPPHLQLPPHTRTPSPLPTFAQHLTRPPTFRSVCRPGALTHSRAGLCRTFLSNSSSSFFHTLPSCLPSPPHPMRAVFTLEPRRLHLAALPHTPLLALVFLQLHTPPHTWTRFFCKRGTAADAPHPRAHAPAPTPNLPHAGAFACLDAHTPPPHYTPSSSSLSPACHAWTGRCPSIPYSRCRAFNIIHHYATAFYAPGMG